MNHVKIYINNKEVTNILQGFSFTNRKDEEYDSFQFISFAQEDKTPYAAGMNASVYLSCENKSIVIDYIVSQDKVSLCSKNPHRYMHEVILEEGTIVLSTKINDTISFTNLDDSKRTLEKYCSRMKKIYPLERESYHETSRELNFQLSDEQKALIMPEMILNYSNVLEQLKTMFNTIDAIPRINGSKIVLDEFNKKGKFIIDDSNVINENMFLDLASNITGYHSYVNNAVPTHNTYFPNENEFITTRTETTIYDAVAGTIKLNFPIEKIEKVEVIIRVNRDVANGASSYDGVNVTLDSQNNYVLEVPYSGRVRAKSHDGKLILDSPQTLKDKDVDSITGDTFFKALDITSSVVLEDEYDTLDELDGSTVVKYGDLTNYKDNTLYYRIGDNHIYGVGFSEKFSILLTGPTKQTWYLLERLLAKYFGITNKSNEFETNSGDDAYNAFVVGVNLNTISFRVSYRPLINPHVKKLKSYKRNEVVVNQSSNKVELLRYGKSLQNYLNRLGHADKTYIRIHKTVDEINNVGDYLEDNYILTASQHIVFQNYILAVETYNKNFNRTNSYVGVDKTTRTFNLANTPCYRDMNYSEYIVISKTIYRKLGDFWNPRTQSLVKDFGIELFLSSFFNKKVNDPITAVRLKTYDADKNSILKEGTIYYPVARSIYGNSFVFYFQFESSTNAGNSKEKSVVENYMVMSPNIYTDKNGEFEYLDFEFITSPKFDKYELVDELPNNNDTFYNSFNDYNSLTGIPAGYPKFYRTSDGQHYEHTYINLKRVSGTIKTDYGWFETYIKHNPIDLYRNWREYAFDTEDANRFPLINNDYNYRTVLGTGLDSNDKLVVSKDAREIISLTYQLNVVSDDVVDIIVGDKFCENNHLISQFTDEIFVYQTTEKYEIIDKVKCKGSINSDIKLEHVMDPWKFHGLKFFSESGKSLLGYNYALGDSNGNLILAINISNDDISKENGSFAIWFNFLHELPF